MKANKEKILWAVKYLLIYVILFFLSAVVGEAIVILGFSIGGYDVLHGVFPQGYWVGLIPLYGYAVYTIITLIYVKLIAKKKLADIRLTLSAKTPWHVIAGILFGAAICSASIVILILTKDYQYAGCNGWKPAIALATLAAYAIQSATEEIMCRGFLQNFLEQKISRPSAIFLSALAFMAPHVLSFESEPVIILISICNLLLVSVLFSLSMVLWNSLWVPIGIHIGWNYLLSYVFGLQLSGMASGANLFLFRTASGRSWLHGGSYGIEAGLIVTIILLIADIVLYLMGKDRVKK